MRRFFHWLRLLLLVLLMAGIFLAAINLNTVTDWIRLRNYTPSTSVSALATQTAMSPTATHLFYINRPALYEDITSFRSACSDNEQTIVLGCYKSGESGISIYNVKDTRLAGIAQVTAAHEMLHAAYDRLSGSQKKTVDAMLQSYYDNGLHDQRIIDTINDYKKIEPNDLLNEMHSIFGTEITTLPQNLEDYYKKYFVNRADVTNYAQQYQAEFTSRSDQIKAYDAQLESLKSQIDSEESSLTQQLAEINANRDNLDRYQQSGDITSYNAAVPGFNRSVDSYNAAVKKLKSDISRYNSLVAARNEIASELKTLDSSIDTRLNTQAGQ